MLAFQKRKQVVTALFEDLPLYILTEHRSAVVALFGLPLSLVWDGLMKIRAQYIHTFYSLLGDGTVVTATAENEYSDLFHAIPWSMFAETLSFSLNAAVVMSGDFIDAKGVPRGAANRLGLWHKPWFFKHAESMLYKKNLRSQTQNPSLNTEPIVEYIPLRDYYHRHTQSLFWEMEPRFHS